MWRAQFAHTLVERNQLSAMVDRDGQQVRIANLTMAMDKRARHLWRIDKGDGVSPEGVSPRPRSWSPRLTTATVGSSAGAIISRRNPRHSVKKASVPSTSSHGTSTSWLGLPVTG